MAGASDDSQTRTGDGTGLIAYIDTNREWSINFCAASHFSGSH